MKKLQGFTLIEIMIVVVIIGILSAFAVPMYSDYTKKAKVSECNMLFSGFKTEMAAFHADKGYYPINLSSLPGLITGGSYVKEVRYSNDPMLLECVLETFDPNENTLAWLWIDDENNRPIRWECRPHLNGQATTLDAKYLPKACRS